MAEPGAPPEPGGAAQPETPASASVIIPAARRLYGAMQAGAAIRPLTRLLAGGRWRRLPPIRFWPMLKIRTQIILPFLLALFLTYLLLPLVNAMTSRGRNGRHTPR